MPGDHRVLDQGGRGGHNAHPHLGDAHPGTSHELEVLRHSPVEHDAAGGVIGIVEPSGVADGVEALRIEGGRGQTPARPRTRG